MFYTYILESKQNRSYYIGSCQDINKRFKLHNSGLVKSTKRYAPWQIVYREEFSILKEAKNRELQIKSWKKRDAVKKLIETFQNFK